MASRKKVLVTGHDGYIGAVLTDLLTAQGHEVTGLDTFYFEDCLRGQGPAPIPSIRKDLRDVTEKDITGMDAIIHLAGLSNDPLGQLSSDLTLTINYKSTVHLATLAKRAGIPQFLYASSCSLYGKSDQDTMNESSPVAPLTAYAQSKVLSEEAILKLAGDGFSPVILRCATVFGASPKLRVDLVVNNLTGLGMTTGKIAMQSDGTPWRPLIHVKDLSRVYAFFLSTPLPAGTSPVFNVGFNTQNYRVRDIAEAVSKQLPRTQITFAEKPDVDSRSYQVNFDRLAAVSGLQPEWDLEKGIAEVAAFYQDSFTFEDFASRKYTRLKQINHLLQTGRLTDQLVWAN